MVLKAERYNLKKNINHYVCKANSIELNQLA